MEVTRRLVLPYPTVSSQPVKRWWKSLWLVVWCDPFFFSSCQTLRSYQNWSNMSLSSLPKLIYCNCKTIGVSGSDKMSDSERGSGFVSLRKFLGSLEGFRWGIIMGEEAALNHRKTASIVPLGLSKMMEQVWEAFNCHGIICWTRLLFLGICVWYLLVSLSCYFSNWIISTQYLY